MNKRLDSDGFSLMISMYDEKNPLRREEMVTCLENNLMNSLIHNIFVFFETKDYPKGTLYEYISSKRDKIKISFIRERPTFRLFIEFANKKLNGKRIIIANTDIFFDYTLNEIKDYDFTDKFFVLTRWNLADDNKLYLQCWQNPVYPWKKIEKDKLIMKPSLQNPYSADAWIFRTPVELDFECEFQLGTYLSDSLLNASLIQKQIRGALQVFNPCLSIRACHLDKNRNKKTRGMYLKYKKEKLDSKLLTKVGKGQVNWCYLKDTLP